MGSIIWALIALVSLAVVAALLGLVDNAKRLRKLAQGLEVEPEPEPAAASEGCCGMHSTCERDSLLSAVSPTIVYYDDEELDRFSGTQAGAYSTGAVEEFREIMLTLDIDDVAGWVRSLQHRGIALPEELLPELFLLVGENRAMHMAHGPGKSH